MKEVRPKIGRCDRLYLYSLYRALSTTIGNLVRRSRANEAPRSRFRGMPRLKHDEQGRVKCVACFLCVAACPAGCIRIEAAATPWEDRDKMPGRFEFDLGRCVFCGLCLEACPEDALDQSGPWTMVARDRDKLVLQVDDLQLSYHG